GPPQAGGHRRQRDALKPPILPADADVLRVGRRVFERVGRGRITANPFPQGASLPHDTLRPRPPPDRPRLAVAHRGAVPQALPPRAVHVVERRRAHRQRTARALDELLPVARDFFADCDKGWGVLVEGDAGHPMEAELRERGWKVDEDEPAFVMPDITAAINPPARPDLAV